MPLKHDALSNISALLQMNRIYIISPDVMNMERLREKTKKPFISVNLNLKFLTGETIIQGEYHIDMMPEYEIGDFPTHIIMLLMC